MRNYMAVLAAAVCLMAGCGQKETTVTATTAVETVETTQETVSEETESTTEETTAAVESETMKEEETTQEETTQEETTQAESTQEEMAQEAETAAGKTVSEIYDEITSQVELVQPMLVPDDFISSYYGIDLSALEEYVFSMSETAISAETVAILKAKEGVDPESLTSALQLVIDQKRAEMENYLPEQFQIVDASSVRVKGSYVYLVISENEASIVKIIEDGLPS